MYCNMRCSFRKASSAFFRSEMSRTTAIVPLGFPAASQITAEQVSVGTKVPSRRQTVYSAFLRAPRPAP